MPENTCLIRVHKDTKEKLIQLGNSADTFETIVTKLYDFYAENHILRSEKLKMKKQE